MPHEKNTAELKIRVTEQMRDEIIALARLDDRTPSEYVRHVLALHLWGATRKKNTEPRRRQT